MKGVYEVKKNRGKNMEDAEKFNNLPVWKKMKKV